MGMQKVSIIIPCYNHAQWLPDAIHSALNQTVKCEVIVVMTEVQIIQAMLLKCLT